VRSHGTPTIGLTPDHNRNAQGEGRVQPNGKEKVAGQKNEPRAHSPTANHPIPASQHTTRSHSHSHSFTPHTTTHTTGDTQPHMTSHNTARRFGKMRAMRAGLLRAIPTQVTGLTTVMALLRINRAGRGAVAAAEHSNKMNIR
jgi:hypothetical protein